MADKGPRLIAVDGIDAPRERVDELEWAHLAALQSRDDICRGRAGGVWQ